MTYHPHRKYIPLVLASIIGSVILSFFIFGILLDTGCINFLSTFIIYIKLLIEYAYIII